MANINLDLTYKKIKENIDGVSTFTYKDLGTSNIKLFYRKQGYKQIPYIYDNNTSNVDLNAIKQSLKNLFSFLPGQSILDPAFGNTLYKFLYQKIDDIIQTEIIRQLKTLIIKYQPRIRLTSVKIQPNIEQLSYSVILKYDVPALGVSSTNILSLSSSDGINFG